MITPASPARPAPARPSAARRGRSRPLAWDLARSEWIKLRTVRSTYWTLLAAAAGMIGFGALLSAAHVRHYTSAGSAAGLRSTRPPTASAGSSSPSSPSPSSGLLS